MGYSIQDFPPWVRKLYNEQVVGKPSRLPGKGRKESRGEAALAGQIKVMGLPEPRRDYGRKAVDGAPWRELLGRNWEADFAWPDQKLAVFVEGQVHAMKHARTNDCERDNVLNLYFGGNWVFFKFTPDQVYSLVVVDSIAAFLNSHWRGGGAPLSGQRRIYDEGDATLNALQKKARY